VKRGKVRISISLQILAFLLIIAFFPIGAMMMLKTYENQLLSETEAGMVQQGRLVAAALEAGAAQMAAPGLPVTAGGAAAAKARALLSAMNGRFDSRIRVIGPDGRLLADSSTIAPPKVLHAVNTADRTEEGDADSTDSSASENWLYRVASLPVRIYRRYFRPPAPPLYESADYYASRALYDGPEIRAALDGRYGAITRISTGGQVSVTLYSAIPVLEESGIEGAVLISRSTYKILQNLYELRLDLARIFAWTLAAVLAISAFLYFRISLPLKKLSAEAQSCADKRGRILSTALYGAKRHDEIGELSRSFTVLLEKLNSRIKFMESFSADVSHEFKNPLAAIRSSAELAGDLSLPEAERSRFCGAITDEVARLQSLLSGVRSISRIDADLDGEEGEKVPLCAFARNRAELMGRRLPAKKFIFRADMAEAEVAVREDYLDRILSNLMENAADFADTVLVSVERGKDAGSAVLSVEDSGPGIPLEEREKVFERFYSRRADLDQSAGQHSGLGLAIVRAAAEASGGTVRIEEGKELGGARFAVVLPLA